MYSFGVLLCEMYIREQPVPGDRERQIERIIDCHRRGLVRQCVQREPWARPNMDEVTKELQTLMSNTHQRQRPSFRRPAWNDSEMPIIEC